MLEKYLPSHLCRHNFIFTVLFHSSSY